MPPIPLAFIAGGKASEYKLYSWGSNTYGQLGLNLNPNYYGQNRRVSPTQVGALTNWTTLGTKPSRTAFVIKQDKTLWGWGRNTYGQVGNNNIYAKSSPVQIGAETWSAVSCGDNFTLAIRTNGSLWGWGENSSGQLGQNFASYPLPPGGFFEISSPVQIGSGTNWATIACGARSSFAIKTDGTLWAWGRNGNGQLGLGDVNYRSSPTQVGSLTNWSKISAGYGSALAIKTDGTLWSWGSPATGLGGGFPQHSSPVQIGSSTTWSKISMNSSSAMAIKTDGTLWAWGSNFQGLLGTNDNIYKSSPVQIGSDTNWSTASVGINHSIAVKTDSTLWTWGGNNAGELGNGSFGPYLSKSSPTQVGSNTNWFAAAAMGSVFNGGSLAVTKT